MANSLIDNNILDLNKIVENILNTTDIKSKILNIYKSNTPKASGNLINSYTLSFTLESEQLVFNLNTADYFEYVDKGTKPRTRIVPVDKIIEYINYKNIIPYNNYNIQNLAYAISNNIAKLGTKPNYITEKSNAEIEKDIIPIIENKIKEAIQSYKLELNNIEINI